jgi:hypothetical protein
MLSNTTSAMASLTTRTRAALQTHRHLVIILAAFLGFRLFLTVGLWLSIGPDIYDYLRWGALTNSGNYPFVHYGSEYPPLLPWAAIILYRVSTLAPVLAGDARFWSVLILRLVFTLLDTGGVILVYGIALQLGSRLRATRTTALFEAGFVPAYAASSWIDRAKMICSRAIILYRSDDQSPVPPGAINLTKLPVMP